MKNNKGITLIALVITIIVLLILAGVTISLVMGQQGIFNNAREATEKYSQQEAKEILAIELANLYIDKTQNHQYNQEQYLTDKLIQRGFQVNGNTVTVNGWEFQIDRSVPQILNVQAETDPIKEPVLAEYVIKGNNQNIAKNVAFMLKDNSNHGVDANLQSAELNQELTGLNFDGISTYSQLDSSKLQMKFPITVTIALNCEKDTESRIIFMDTNSKVGIGTYLGRLYVTANAVSNYYELPADFYLNKINYITVVYTSTITDHQVYLNGQKLNRSTGTGNWANNEANSYLGRRNSGDYFKGTLYDFKIYHEAFSEQKVQEHYQNMKKFLETQENVQIYKENLYLDYTIKNNPANISKNQLYILKDKTSNGNDIVMQNAEYTKDKTGVEFNGTSTYGKFNKLEVKLPTTISIVAKWEQDSQSRILIADSDSDIVVGTSNRKMYITGMTKSNCYDLPSDFDSNAMNYITIVYHDLITDHELYINGKKMEKSEVIGGWVLSGTNKYLGKRDASPNPQAYFKGILYKFKIYEGDLTQEQVVKEYEQNKEYFSS